MKAKHLFFLFTLLLFSTFISGQTQDIRGQVLENETNIPIIGAHVTILGTQPLLGTVTDIDGKFTFKNVTIGRLSIEISAMAYETQILSELLLQSGKELVLPIELEETFYALDELTITAENITEGSNEMALVSSKSFSIEETQRYAAAFSDPSRMASSFAGVANSGDDLSNEISIRGNSPRGMQWRLEGVDIPSPNHFGSLGSSGGGISMLSSNTLATSDFYTGAFPAEYGDVLSGVFDLKMRKGNNLNREYIASFGLLGLEASAEGPFSKGKSSYLVNYRYSTFGLLKLIYDPLDGTLPNYQDGSFKLHFPSTKRGDITVFGLFGSSKVYEEDEDDSFGPGSFEANQNMAIGGLSHFIGLSEKHFLRSSIAVSRAGYTDLTLIKSNMKEIDVTTFGETDLTIRTDLSIKQSNRTSYKLGINLNTSAHDYDYKYRDEDQEEWIQPLDKNSNATRINNYVQMKKRFTENFDMVIGIQHNYFLLNEEHSIEPRAAIEYRLNDNSSLSLAAGLHSQAEHSSTYAIDVENENGIIKSANESLKLQKAAHLVAGYKTRVGALKNLKIEAYYQHLYDIPIAKDEYNFSTLNALSIWDIPDDTPLFSEGKGRNIGIDMSFNRPLKDDLYYHITASIYSSTFQNYKGERFSTRYDGNYSLNLIGGREYKLRSSNILGVNTRIIWTGGNRTTPLILEESIIAGHSVRDHSQKYSKSEKDYLRADLSFYYKINKEKTTKSIILELQNVTNRMNTYSTHYNSVLMEEFQSYQTGLFPNLKFEVQF